MAKSHESQQKRVESQYQEFLKKEKEYKKNKAMISDTKQAINEIMGVKNSNNVFRPITKAIEATDAEERAKDKRQNQGGFSKM